MKVIGVDPGTRVTGYGIVQKADNQFFPVEYGVIKPPASRPLSKRYSIIFDGLTEIISDFSPDVVAVESTFYVRNISSAMKLSQVRGIVLLAASKAGLEVYEYAPRKVKQAVCGRGGATKYQVQKMVQSLLSLDVPPEPVDASDAMAIAICHLQSINHAWGVARKQT